MAVIVNEPTTRELADTLPWPDAHANKYTRGRLVALGGDAAYPGAVSLAALAAMRMGSGYVEVVCAPETLSVVHALVPDAVARSWEGWSPWKSRLDAPTDERHPQACLVGPGMDAAAGATGALVLAALEGCACPVVVDGGAISALSTREGRALAERRGRAGLATVVTPHLGEAARMAAPLSLDVPATGGGRDGDAGKLAAFARALAEAYAATVVLKGPDTFVADPSTGVVDVMRHGGPCLAKAGTGDVLAGMVSALASQGVPSRAAVDLAASLHAWSASDAAEDLTAICVRATDVIERIPRAIQRLVRDSSA